MKPHPEAEALAKTFLNADETFRAAFFDYIGEGWKEDLLGKLRELPGQVQAISAILSEQALGHSALAAAAGTVPPGELQSDHRECVLLIANAARLVALLELPKALAAAERALAVGFIVAPTAWAENSDKLDEDIAVLQAALPLWRLAEQLRRSGP